MFSSFFSFTYLVGDYILIPLPKICKIDVEVKDFPNN